MGNQIPIAYEKMQMPLFSCAKARGHKYDTASLNGNWRDLKVTFPWSIGRGSGGSSPPLFFILAGNSKFQRAKKERKKRWTTDWQHHHFQHSLFSMLHKISPIMATWRRDEYHGECRVVAWIFTIRRRPLIFYVEKRSQTYFHATV
jgi:hypothetical protein